MTEVVTEVKVRVDKISAFRITYPPFFFWIPKFLEKKEDYEKIKAL